VIDGLDNLLAETRQPGLPELRRYLADLFAADGASGRIVEVSKLLRSRVFRVTAEVNESQRSLIIKRLTPELAYKEKRVLERWLPRIEMNGYGPPLIGTVPEQTGQCVWHVYEDLGPWTLDKQLGNEDAVKAATCLVAELHQRGADHPVLAECRSAGSEFGIWFYETSIRDGIRNLAALNADAKTTQPEQRQLVDRLLERLHTLWDERTYRAAAMAAFGGPETLLHGDLWTTNIFVTPGDKLTARLIDWDHIGVGQVAYDLSTYLLRFPAASRRGVLDIYRAATTSFDWELPAADEFNLLCETAEYARLTTATIWAAINAHADPVAWAFAELEAVDQWFEALQPILPVTGTDAKSLALAAGDRSG
jgi:hypothetical protein